MRQGRHNGLPSEGEYPAPAYAWYVVFTLLLVGITSFLDRYLISLLVDPIRRTLEISDTQVSLLQGAAFAVFYVAFGLPFGMLVDRSNRRNILVVGIALWSAMTFACGLAGNFWELFLARAGVGIGEACLAPAAFSLIADYFPPLKRGRAMSVYNMANYLGVGASLLVGGLVLRALGGATAINLPGVGDTLTWRAVFFIVGAPGLLLAALMFTVREEPRKVPPGAAGQHGPSFGDFFAHLASDRTAYMLVYFVSAMTAFVGLTLAAWGPSFFIRTFAMKPAAAGLLIGPVNAVFGVTGCLASGWLSDRLIATGRMGGRFAVPLIWWPIALLGLAILALTTSKDMAIVAFAIITFGSGLGLASVAPTIQDLTPNRLRGRAVSLHFIFSGLLGMGLAPTLIALVTDRILHDPLALRASLLLVLVPVALVSLCVTIAGQRAYDRARLRVSRSTSEALG